MIWAELHVQRYLSNAGDIVLHDVRAFKIDSTLGSQDHNLCKMCQRFARSLMAITSMPGFEQNMRTKRTIVINVR